MNNDILKEVSAQISRANNVLVAVSTNPTVDELSASVGLTLLLNKLGKHATTVFSGVVPSTLEFLQPEQAIEKTTDSLRDFIIALDKSKADKLRYKVEDNVVRIFITPYKSTISESDLNFSLGEFNVDVVVAIGISRRDDVDRAVTAHGRILHDAAVLALTNKDNLSDFGAINWNEPRSSSLCEMVTAVAYQLSAEKIDGQMATALLTGIIAETDRFRNNSTTPQSLDFASRLMTAGANQQLIADELESAMNIVQGQDMQQQGLDELPMPHDPSTVPRPLDHKEDDGSLQIDHTSSSDAQGSQGDDDPNVENIEIDEHGNLSNQLEPNGQPQSQYLQAQPEEKTTDFSTDTEMRSDYEGARQTMTHGKTIQPIHEPEYPTSSENFDPAAALQAMQGDPQQMQSSMPQPHFSQSAAQQASEPVATTPAVLPPYDQSDDQTATTPQSSIPTPQPLDEQESQAPVPQAQLNPVTPPEPTVVNPTQPVAQPTVSPSVPQPLDQSQEQPTTEQPLEVSSVSSEPHPQTLEDLERAVGSDHVSSTIPQPIEMPDVPEQSDQQPQPTQPEQQSQQVALDPSSVPTPLSEDQQNSPDAPPPVPPPMQPQFFDQNGHHTQ